jgi:hypothetical protein
VGSAAAHFFCSPAAAAAATSDGGWWLAGDAATGTVGRSAGSTTATAEVNKRLIITFKTTLIMSEISSFIDKNLDLDFVIYRLSYIG